MVTSPPPVVDLRQLALFLDFDGTLVEIADHPDNITLEAGTRAKLTALASQLDGALAIITGRAIDDVLGHLAPLALPVAGVHGLVRRTAAGDMDDMTPPAHVIEGLRKRLSYTLDLDKGILLETKPGAVAVHFRACPDQGEACIAAAEDAVAATPGFVVSHGKMVVEARSSASDKGQAIAAYLNEPPFAGRRPMFVGDDVTDEDGFRAVNGAGGISIKIGAGNTVARHRIDSTRAFLEWLGTLAHVQRSENTR